ncbi:MAG: cysteine peptidase family C39 domain-containing protein, partial [Candidatus Omnitrophota bacterium]|nr:cysteine peptidase family C39 domain-containing protein [Candidatus Omnitrophota bacterium]
MIKPKIQTEDRVAAKKESKEKFHSSFKTWIRVVAFIVAAVFLPEQVAQAVEYDWRVLWNKPAIGLPSNNVFSPNYLKNVQSVNIPQAVKSILKDIANKPITAIKISDNLTINLNKPLKMSNQRIDELYNWLLGKPCGSKALYDYLNYKGIQVEEQDIAVLALTIDILNDVVKPEGNPKVIKNSLYALSRTSAFFGAKLYPVSLRDCFVGLRPPRNDESGVIASEPTGERSNLLSSLVPFIAHLNGDHYVLVTRISEDKIYFSDQHREEFLPIDKFLKEFSGYALVTSKDLPPISDNEAKTILGAKSDYSSDWHPSASNAQMQAYSNKTMESLHSEIKAMRTHAEHQFIKDITISVGSSFAMAAISSYAKPWFNTKSTGVGSKVLGLGPTARWAITGAVAGTAVHGLTTGQWFKGNWYLYTAGGAAAGAAVPSVAQAWNTQGSWLSPVRKATDSFKSSINGAFGGTPDLAQSPWEFPRPSLGTTAQLDVTAPGLFSNLGGVGHGMFNAGVVTLTSNIFSLAGMKPQQTELLSAFTSGALLGMVGGLGNMTNGLQWYQAGISGGLSNLTSTYVTSLATEQLSIKSPALAKFIGDTAGLATSVLVNGAFYSLNGQSIDMASPKIKIGLPADLGTGDKILKAGIGTYGEYIWNNSWRGWTASLVGNGVAEIITRNPKLIGLTAKDLETMPYASAIGQGITSGFGSAFKNDTFIQSISKGLLTSALTIGEAKIEADMLKHNPRMTPVMSAYLIDAGTAAFRGFMEGFLSPTVTESIRNQKLDINNQTFEPDSAAIGFFTRTFNALETDGLNASSFGYTGRELSAFGEISYMHTLTATFGPTTPEILRQQMAKGAFQGTAVGEGSTVNVALSDGTLVPLTLSDASKSNLNGSTIIPFMGTQPRKDLTYTDIGGNKWTSNGDGTYALQSVKKQEGSFIAGWAQIAHDSYQSGAVRNMVGTIAVIPAAREFLHLPVSFMTHYKDAKGDIQDGSLVLERTNFTDKLATTSLRTLSISDNFGNPVFSQTTQNQRVIDEGKIKSFSAISANYWAKGEGFISRTENFYYDKNTKQFMSNSLVTTQAGTTTVNGLAGTTFSKDYQSELQLSAQFLQANGISTSVGDGKIYLPGKPMQGVQLLVGGTLLLSPQDGKLQSSVVVNNDNGKLKVSGWAYHSDNPYFNNIGVNGVSYTNKNLADAEKALQSGNTGSGKSKDADSDDSSGGSYNVTKDSNTLIFNLNRDKDAARITPDGGLVMGEGDRVRYDSGTLTGIGSNVGNQAFKISADADNGEAIIGALGVGRTGKGVGLIPLTGRWDISSSGQTNINNGQTVFTGNQVSVLNNIPLIKDSSAGFIIEHAKLFGSGYQGSYVVSAIAQGEYLLTLTNNGESWVPHWQDKGLITSIDLTTKESQSNPIDLIDRAKNGTAEALASRMTYFSQVMPNGANTNEKDAEAEQHNLPAAQPGSANSTTPITKWNTGESGAGFESVSTNGIQHAFDLNGLALNPTAANSVNVSSMFNNAEHTFVNNYAKSAFTSGVQLDDKGNVTGRMIAAIPLNEGSLAGKTVQLNDHGFVITGGFKSGWRSINANGSFFKTLIGDDKDNVALDKAGLENVSFWVANGGAKFLNFSIGVLTLEGNKYTKNNGLVFGVAENVQGGAAPYLAVVPDNPLILTQTKKPSTVLDENLDNQLSGDRANELLGRQEIVNKLPTEYNAAKDEGYKVLQETFAKTYAPNSTLNLYLNPNNGVIYADGTQRVNVLISNLNSTNAALSGDFRNTTFGMNSFGRKDYIATTVFLDDKQNVSFTKGIFKNDSAGGVVQTDYLGRVTTDKAGIYVGNPKNRVDAALQSAKRSEIGRVVDSTVILKDYYYKAVIGKEGAIEKILEGKAGQLVIDGKNALSQGDHDLSSGILKTVTGETLSLIASPAKLNNLE